MDRGMVSIVYFVVIIGIFYLLLIRPQQRRQKEQRNMVAALKVNDNVVTAGGILGTIARIKDNSVWLKVADKVEIEVLKTSINVLRETEKK